MGYNAIDLSFLGDNAALTLSNYALSKGERSWIRQTHYEWFCDVKHNSIALAGG